MNVPALLRAYRRKWWAYLPLQLLGLYLLYDGFRANEKDFAALYRATAAGTITGLDAGDHEYSVTVELNGNRLHLAMKNPLDIFATDEIRVITGKEVVPVIATEEDILFAIGEAFKGEGTESDAILKEFQDDVSIDTCEKCGGVWLDSGELDQLTKKEKSGFLGKLWGG